MTFRCYAQRLLNPFRGAMHIIEHDGAEAVTLDGVRWDIYVRDLALVRDLSVATRVQTSEIRYGSWSEKTGLKRGAIYPSEDFRVLEERGALLYEYLLRHHRDVPFPFADRFELWLLDTDSRPLGLLNSAVDARDMELDCPIAWRAGRDCAGQFRPDGHAGPEAAGVRIERLINLRAGDAPRAQWFERLGDGSGKGLAGINADGAHADRSLQAEAFPRWFVRPSDTDDEERLYEQFFDWQAPCLLLLQDLDPATRRRFEHLAAGRALAVEKLHRLYPEILDQDAIRRARVEAALRAHQGEGRDRDETMATFYIELNISRTN